MQETKQNEILFDILNAGGVVTTRMLATGYKINEQVARLNLEELLENGFLTKRDYFLKNKSLYQVTKKACNIFGKGESNLRKPHKDIAMRRYLTKADVYFTLKTREQKIVLPNFENEKKIYLTKELGISEKFLPKRVYKDKGGNKTERAYFDDMLSPVCDNNISIIAIDDYKMTQEVMLNNFIAKYNRLGNNGKYTLEVSLVTDDKARAMIFENLYNLNFKNKNNFTLYFKYLQNSYEKETKNESLFSFE